MPTVPQSGCRRTARRRRTARGWANCRSRRQPWPAPRRACCFVGGPLGDPARARERLGQGGERVLHLAGIDVDAAGDRRRDRRLVGRRRRFGRAVRRRGGSGVLVVVGAAVAVVVGAAVAVDVAVSAGPEDSAPSESPQPQRPATRRALRATVARIVRGIESLRSVRTTTSEIGCRSRDPIRGISGAGPRPLPSGVEASLGSGQHAPARSRSASTPVAGPGRPSRPARSFGSRRSR